MRARAALLPGTDSFRSRSSSLSLPAMFELAASGHRSGRWAADLAPDVTRVAVAGMDRRLAGQLGQDVPAVCPPEVSGLVCGMLALVRDGLTNREIGTRLFISPRTVQTHVSHILQKTGLRSRVEIARFAGA